MSIHIDVCFLASANWSSLLEVIMNMKPNLSVK